MNEPNRNALSMDLRKDIEFDQTDGLRRTQTEVRDNLPKQSGFTAIYIV